MKNPLLTILTLSALALATAPFAEAAYMEGGKPVTKRHQAEPKKSLPEEKIQEKAPEPGAEKPKEAEAAPEKTKETPPPLAETKPQAKPVPAALPPPVPVAGEKEEIPLGPDDANAEPGPKYAKEETAPPADEKKEATKRLPWPAKPVPG